MGKEELIILYFIKNLCYNISSIIRSQLGSNLGSFGLEANVLTTVSNSTFILLLIY